MDLTSISVALAIGNTMLYRCFADKHTIICVVLNGKVYCLRHV